MIIERKLCIFAVAALLLSGCGARRADMDKKGDLEYETACGPDLPETLRQKIEEEKAEPFLAAYGDGQRLYIALGYGEQESAGYSIQIEEVYETEDAVFIRTCLTGPDEGEEVAQEADCPWTALATGYTEKRILWEM